MKKIIKKLHLYLALTLGMPLIIQGISGAILVFEKEIKQAKYQISAGEKQQLSKIIFTAKQEVENEFGLGFETLGIKFNQAAFVRFSKKNSKENLNKEIVIDPVSLKILAIKNPDNDFFRLTKKFHESLLIKGEIGKNIVGIYGFVLLFMAISGVILWYPKKGNFKRSIAFKFSDKGKKFHRDLHSAIGFYLAIPMFLIAFSGIYFIYPNFVKSLILLQEKEKIQCKILQKNSEKTKIISVDEALNFAKINYDDLTFTSLPTKDNRCYRFNFVTKKNTPQNIIFVDKFDGKILSNELYENFSFRKKIIAWQHILHVGEEFGIFSKVINFLVGISFILFFITGIYLWLLKKRKAK